MEQWLVFAIVLIHPLILQGKMPNQNQEFFEAHYVIMLGSSAWKADDPFLYADICLWL
jgi:hypothetical protein